MCVVIASKIKLKNSEKENWFLYKIRDRAYTPEYKIRYNTGHKTGVQSGYIVDNDSDWSEGVNEKGIMIVNAALQNHEDKKDGTSKGKKVSKGKVSRNGVIIREALKQDKIEEVVKILVDARFDGNTLVSDGKRLFILEIFLHQNTKDKILTDLEMDPVSDEDDVKAILAKHIKPEDYDVKVKEVKGDERLVVRTNHGILLPKAGYQPKDGVGFESSLNRRKVVIDTIEKLEPEHPFEILTALKNLGTEDIHKEDIMRPIRTIPASPYLSTTILMLTGTGSLFILPLDCKFEDTSFNRIQKDRKVHIVVLPQKLPLFEDKNEMNEIYYYNGARINSLLDDVEQEKLEHIEYKGSKYILFKTKKYFVLTNLKNEIMFYIQYYERPSGLHLGTRENVSNEKNLFFKVVYTLLFKGYFVCEDHRHNDLSIKAIKKLIEANVIKVLYDGKDITKELIDNNFDDNDINKKFTYSIGKKDTKYLIENINTFGTWKNVDVMLEVEHLIKDTFIIEDEELTKVASSYILNEIAKILK